MSVQGVRYYTAGQTTVEVHFPNGDVACKWCWPFLQSDTALGRYRCKRTGESIPDPKHEIGLKCPLRFQEEET